MFSCRCQPMDEPIADDLHWGRMQALMLGVALAHVVQPVAVVTGLLAWRDKYVVSACGAVLYGFAYVALMSRQRLGLYIALGGPVLGMTAVLGGWLPAAMG